MWNRPVDAPFLETFEPQTFALQSTNRGTTLRSASQVAKFLHKRHVCHTLGSQVCVPYDKCERASNVTMCIQIPAGTVEIHLGISSHLRSPITSGAGTYWELLRPRYLGKERRFSPGSTVWTGPEKSCIIQVKFLHKVQLIFTSLTSFYSS